MTNEFPVLKEIFEKHPSIFGYEATDNLIKYIIIITSCLISLSISIVFLYLNFLRILRKNKQHLSSGTYNMQLMLMKALFIQIAIFGLLLVLPITSAYTLTLFGFKQMPVFSLIAIAILGTHAFVDFCVLSYFVRSYREYIKSLVNKVKKKLGLKVKEVVLTQVAPSTSSDMPSRYR
uniref:G_PROTEIN_RECEP_F1_2 domain-containing protein n=1 Tax=Panagrellus redivivus TaxID=6233 RepID=A0A7E4V1G6_PANRE